MTPPYSSRQERARKLDFIMGVDVVLGILLRGMAKLFESGEELRMVTSTGLL